MKYQEIKIGETYLYNNKEYTVLYKHDETQSVFAFSEVSIATTNFHKDYLFDLKPKVKLIPERGLFRGSKGSLIYRNGETSGYGFTNGKFGDSFFCIFDNDWKEATKEDYKRFKELVIQHLKGLGFNDGDSFISLYAGVSDYIVNFGGDIGLGGYGIFLGENYVYFNNEWIKPISAQKKLKKDIETRIKELEQTIQQLKKDIKE